jgi:arginine N-succinyltransferase
MVTAPPDTAASSAASAAGVTGLTPQREYLFDRIQQSLAALESDIACQTEESYTFML